MEKIEAFRASDGSLFAHADDCARHELQIRLTPQIEAFCDSKVNPYPSVVYRKLVKKVIVAWEWSKSHSKKKVVSFPANEKMLPPTES